jgi:hypothetical protein
MIDPDLARLVIERGQRASDLLGSDTFQWIVEDQTSYHLAALVAAPPGPKGADAVAYHHSLQHALSELVASLKGHAEAGAAMERALAEMAEQEDDTDL